jgi:hypothetical protein
MEDKMKKESKQDYLQKQWSLVVAKVWTDEKFKKKLLANPHQVLRENGINVPEDINIHISENTTKDIYVNIPLNISALSESELKSMNAAAAQSYCGTCFL